MIFRAAVELEPQVPVAIADAVEKWARGRGLHARLMWERVLGCFVVKFTLPGTSTAAREVQEGRAEEATECVPLHEWDGELGTYVPLRLEDYGESGLVNMLERMDTRSGRGLYDSLHAAIAATREHNRKVAAGHRQAMEDAQAEVLDRARSVMGVPFHRVGIDLKNKE